MNKARMSWMNVGKVFALVIFSCIFLPSKQAAAQTVQQCGKEIPVPVDGGAYKVENNKFNSTQSECINIDTATTNFTVAAGSAINVPTNGPPGGYPSIYAGCHWGNCANATTLPLRISALGKRHEQLEHNSAKSGAFHRCVECRL